jgi:hypothetical protein
MEFVRLKTREDPLVTSFKFLSIDTRLELTMQTKSMALAIMFAAVAIALTTIQIPTLFYPGGFFRFSQIPVVIAFLLFGFRIGALVGFVTLMGQIVVFPFNVNAFFIAYPMDFAASIVMFLGIDFSSRLLKNDGIARYPALKKPIIGLTSFAALFRAGIMSLVDFGVVFHILLPITLGIKLSDAFILGLVPAFVAYNAITAIYVVSVACLVAKQTSKHLRLQAHYL